MTLKENDTVAITVDNSKKCVLLFRKRGTFIKPSVKTYLNLMTNELINTLKKLGFNNRKIRVNWFYKFSGAEMRERMGYYLFLVEGISFEELWNLYEKNWSRLTQYGGEIVPLHSDDIFTRFIIKIREITL